MTAPEQWLPVVTYEGLYEVSDLGQARSVDRLSVHGDHVQPHRGQLLTPWINRYGYPCVRLSRDGRGRTRPLHVLVAEAFLSRPEDATQVRHRDGDTSNPAATNLRWGTQRDNEIDKREHGTVLPTWLPHERCVREHLLDGPNLIRESDGRRRCLACRRARTDVRDARVRRGEVLDLAERADHHYRLITKGVAV